MKPILLAALALLPATAAVAQPPLVCARPEVLRVVRRELDQAGIVARFNASGIGERSVPGSATTLCSVKLLFRTFDTGRYGYAPQYRMVVRGYEVQRRPNSFRVRLLD